MSEILRPSLIHQEAVQLRQKEIDDQKARIQAEQARVADVEISRGMMPGLNQRFVDLLSAKVADFLPLEAPVISDDEDEDVETRAAFGSRMNADGSLRGVERFVGKRTDATGVYEFSIAARPNVRPYFNFYLSYDKLPRSWEIGVDRGFVSPKDQDFAKPEEMGSEEALAVRNLVEEQFADGVTIERQPESEHSHREAVRREKGHRPNYSPTRYASGAESGKLKLEEYGLKSDFNGFSR